MFGTVLIGVVFLASLKARQTGDCRYRRELWYWRFTTIEAASNTSPARRCVSSTTPAEFRSGNKIMPFVGMSKWLGLIWQRFRN
jgi:hypothetical protein